MASPSTQVARPPADTGSFYLPDFCAPRSVLVTVLITELVALVLTFARQGLHDAFLTDLGRTSLFLLWIGLGSAAVLCLARPHLARLGVNRGSVAALLMLLGTTLLVSEAAWWGTRTGLYALAAQRSGSSTAHLLFLFRNLTICLIVSAVVLRYFYVAHEWARNVEMEARSRVRALQARIRPHFLFNSMNTIAALTRSNPSQAEEAVEDLADLFRANLSEMRNQISLKEELEVARIYQRIEQLRLGQRLTVRWEVTELPMRALVPSLLVQPLLENAIYHGIERLPEGGTVTVRGSQNDGRIELEISNPVPESMPTSDREGNRVALGNIRERLELVYPGSADVQVETPPGRYVVRLRFPHREAER
jgi:two-component system sensor histidine kinase AlgZ